MNKATIISIQFMLLLSFQTSLSKAMTPCRGIPLGEGSVQYLPAGSWKTANKFLDGQNFRELSSDNEILKGFEKDNTELKKDQIKYLTTYRDKEEGYSKNLPSESSRRLSAELANFYSDEISKLISYNDRFHIFLLKLDHVSENSSEIWFDLCNDNVMVQVSSLNQSVDYYNSEKYLLIYSWRKLLGYSIQRSVAR